LEEREKIARGLAQKKTLTAIAGGLGRSVSTVSREVARNSGATATALPGPIGCRRCGPAGHDPASWPITRRRGVTWREAAAALVEADFASVNQKRPPPSAATSAPNVAIEANP
jgi:hypothetical protein